MVITASSSAKKVLPCSPDEAWRLLNDPVSLRLAGAVHGFDIVDAPADLGALRLVFWRSAARVVGPVLFRVTLVEPGRHLALRSTDRTPAEWSLDIRVSPARRGGGARVTIDSRLRGIKARQRLPTKLRWNRQLRMWLEGLSAVLTGHAEWPSTSLSAAQALEFVCPPPAGSQAVEATADVDIRAPIDVVWRYVWDPQTAVKTKTWSTVHAGHVAGTPLHAVGEMQYFLHDNAGSVVPVVSVVTDLDEGRSATVRTVGHAYAVDHELQAAPDRTSTRLRLVHHSWGDVEPATIRSHAVAGTQGFKDFIEDLVGRGCVDG